MINKIVIIGATSAMAEQCARIWICRGVTELVLVGRDEVRTERVAADLRVRSPSSQVRVMSLRFEDEHAIAELVDTICSRGVPDIVLIAHGSLPEQSICQHDLHNLRSAIEINGVSPVLFAEAFAQHFANVGRGTLILIGSVAGDRGRKSNYAYGAAKGLVTRYAQGLQHRFASTEVKIVLVKPGPTDTPMTAHLKSEGGKLASVESVAQSIVSGADKGASVVYAPAKWALIMLVIRHLPGFIFNKMDI